MTEEKPTVQRPIKFRAWNRLTEQMVTDESVHIDTDGSIEVGGYSTIDEEGGSIEIMQSTGLLDKNGITELYECDIIDKTGNLIGNRYENETLLKDRANFVIEGLGTKNWRDTEAEALKRGCQYAQRYDF